MSRKLLISIILIICTIINNTFGFYLPGVAPKEYANGEEVRIKVNKLQSTVTQLPYDYYKLPFCKPKIVKKDAENLGEILTGDKIENSAYKINMLDPKDCVPLCKKSYNKQDLFRFAQKIDEKYRVNMIVDNLPAAQKFKTIITQGKKEIDDFIYEQGYPLGYMANSGGKKFIMINNHIDLIILYHTDPRYQEKGHRIVGFEVQARSIDHDLSNWDNKIAPEDNSLACQSNLNVIRISDENGLKKKLDVVWTYSVQYDPSDIKWAMRWDAYLKMTDPQIHWFSILNSFMIVIFLSGMVGMILMRALHKDLRRYNQNDLEQLEQQLEETGWKLVHGDVFRTPEYTNLFCCIIGTGTQVFIMTLLTLLFAALGFLSPANRGSLMTTLLLLYIFMSILNGYYCSKYYKMFGKTQWQKQTLYTSLLFPALFFSIFFILNLFVWNVGSSGAVPFGTMFSIIILWFGISLPLVYLGSYFGYKSKTIEFPCKTNELLRMIPDQPWYMNKYFSILIGGILPFGAVFIEIFFIMSSVWLHHFYYMFGFLLLVFIILILTSAEITLVMTYFQLCSEDWQWWWRSVFTAGSSSLYLFGYSILYYHTKLDIELSTHFVSSVLYFGYMLLVSIIFFLVTGTIGFYSTFRFIKKIYGAIKIE